MTNPAIEQAMRMRQVTDGDNVEERKISTGGELSSVLSDQGEGGEFTETVQHPGPANKVPLWEVSSGVQTDVPQWLLNWALQEKDANGYRFTPFQEEAATPTVGTNLCLLHPDHPDRAIVEAAGVGGILCRKSNLRSLFDVRRHGNKKHPDEIDTIDNYKATVAAAGTSEKEAQEKELRMLQIQMMNKQLNNTDSLVDEDSVMRVGDFKFWLCRTEGCAKPFDSPQGRTQHEKTH